MQQAEPDGIPNAGLLQLAVSVVLLSCSWPVTKMALTMGASPMWFAVGRAGLSGTAAFVALAALGRLRLPSRHDLPALLGVGVLQLAAFFALAHAAAAWIPAGRTAILGNVTTIWIVPLSLLVLGEVIPLRRWLAAGLGMAGVAVLISPWSIDWSSRAVVLGHALLLLAALAWSTAITIVRRYPPRGSMLDLLPWSFLVATLLLTPLAAATQPGLGQWPPASLAGLAFIGLFAGPVGTWCLMEVAATLPSMVASVGFLAAPALSLLLSAWWLGEPLTADLLIGAAFIILGVAVAAIPSRRRVVVP